MTITGIRSRPPAGGSGGGRNPLAIVSAAGTQGATTQLMISATGDVDADNAKSFADQVCALVSDDREVLLDLSGLGFFAVDGCTALHAVNALVMRRGAAWSVIPSRGVSRVLTLCDPACLIPITSIEELAEPA